ncbi:helix-turn-helix transcriptional regulator [Nucisporomicrobium flavum]|uniref:helix-turn-helix transcriptional regulator n=1 Tax=Nucisporomicrobium flavum TaxID=2785915 RepID=UPI003C30C8F1
MRLLCPTVVGRAAELDLLGRLVPAAARGTGGTVFLTGSAGMGKTRLARAVQQQADELGLVVLRGRAVPSVQFRPLTEALLGAVRRGVAPDPAGLGPYRSAIAGLVPEWGLPRSPDLDGHPVVLAEAVLRLLVGVAGDRGCLLVLEDLHDADADTLMIVDYLADNIADQPVLLLGTMRPGHECTALAYAAEQRRSASVLALSPLDPAAVRLMAAGCLGVAPAEVPQAALDRVVRSSDGVPFYVEELLSDMVTNAMLISAGEGEADGGPASSDAVASPVPAAVRAGVTDRARRLSVAAQRLLMVAAVCSQPCPGPVLGAGAGLDASGLRIVLREVTGADLLTVDSRTGRYAFPHALVADAVRDSALPEELAEASRSAAEAIERTCAGLPEEWCVLAGRLWEDAGEDERAATLFHRAGRRAADQGAVRTAVTLLERGLRLATRGAGSHPETGLIVEALLEMLVASGEVTRARRLSAQVDRHVAAAQRAAVHLRVARAAVAAGQWDAGRRELAEVRELTGPDAGTALTAATDVVAARLAVADDDAYRLRRAEELARRALRTAGAGPLPDLACEALAVLGVCARVDDLGRADELFARGLAVAERYGLTLWRIRFLFHLGAHAAIRYADPAGLVEARDTASDAGAVITALDGDAELAVLQTCRGEYEPAARRALHCEQVAHRLGLDELRLIALGLRICVAAHRGRRDEVTELLAAYDGSGGRHCDFTAALQGFGLAVCSLLEEDHARAYAEMTEAVALESNRPPEYLSLNHGLHLLLTVLAGTAGWAQYDSLALSARGQAGWNRLFMAVAGAVLAGRGGDHDLADRMMAEFDQVAAAYPLGRHLGLRLAAEAAVEDGWGRPGPWLRLAEQHFHAAGVPRVADACRALLRRAGERAPQRRHGADRIPAVLRQAGVTVREYEVLALLVDRMTNQQIGERLFVSPRTVETHVTRLLAKTGLADRTALADHARSVTARTGDPGREPAERGSAR